MAISFIIKNRCFDCRMLKSVELQKFKRIIRECNYDNTYKMAFAKSLVELSMSEIPDDEMVEIPVNSLAWKFLKYYWNQTIFFDLVQGSNLRKIPEIVQYTKRLIELYHEFLGTKKPERFEKVETLLSDHLNKDLDKTIRDISVTICKDVAWRFTRIGDSFADDVLTFDKKKKVVCISKQTLNALKDNAEDLFDLINYRWGMILETFNSSPRINKKVKIIDQEDIKRNSLKKYERFLDVENPMRTCFICGKKIDEKDLSIDHVIPWSYVYSDDLWNLVYVHKGCNSFKSNSIPDEEEVLKLKERNVHLLEILRKRELSGKWIDELEVAINKDYVDKFWIGCK